MRAGRFLRWVVAGGLGLVWGLGTAVMAGAEPEVLWTFGRTGTTSQCGVPLAAVTAMRATLRYPGIDVELVGPAFDIGGFGGTVQFDASNTPGFNNFAALITDGRRDAPIRLDRAFLIGGEPILAEGEFADDGVEPDLQGRRIAFVRLTVSGLDAGVSNTLCAPGVFQQFAGGNVLWEVWGEPTVSFGLHSDGCQPCAAGEVATFVAEMRNTGPPLSAELKLSVMPHAGPPINLLGDAVQLVVPTGSSFLVLASFAVPAEAPSGAYLVEAALIDPVRGTTLARDRVIAVKE